MRARIVRLPHARDLDLPAYGTAGSAGMDLRAAIPDDAPVTLAPGQRAMVPAGISIAVPPGFEAQVRPRSGLAVKHGISCVNTPGTIDSDYRGEVHVVLVNLGQEPFTLRRGQRIAQMVVAAYARVEWEEVESLSGTDRGAGGFGSTGRG